MRGRFPTFLACGALALSVVSLPAGRAGPASSGAAQSETQNGFTITLRKVETTLRGTLLHVGLENRGKQTVYFYDVNTEIWLDGERFEPERSFGLADELPATVPPGSRAEGVIRFPRIAADGREAVIRFQRAASATEDAWFPVEFRVALPAPVQAEPPEMTVASSAKVSPRIAIIKADDLIAPSANWERFIAVSARRGIKVSIGIICDSLQKDHAGWFDWLRAQQKNAGVEFWNHGWDHKRVGQGRAVSEFNGSGYAYQKKHLADSQEIFGKVLGRPPVAFGTPWNEFDHDTVRVVNEDPDVRLFFGHKEGILDAGKVIVRLLPAEEGDGGSPDFGKFKAPYESQKDRLDVISLQFHPPRFLESGFVEYQRMLDFLIQEGWTFMLPREYLDQLDREATATASRTLNP